MCPKRIFRAVGNVFSGIFGGGNRGAAMIQPQRIQAPPPLKPTQPLRSVPTPQDLKKDYEDPNLIVGKKRKKLEVDLGKLNQDMLKILGKIELLQDLNKGKKK